MSRMQGAQRLDVHLVVPADQGDQSGNRPGLDVTGKHLAHPVQPRSRKPTVRAAAQSPVPPPVPARGLPDGL